MALSRKFLNLIAYPGIPGALSLHCIDLASQRFFETVPQPVSGICSETNVNASSHENKRREVVALKKVERIQLPSPILNFGTVTKATKTDMKCFPLAGRDVLCVDQCGRTFLLDADRRNVFAMPDLCKPKSWPLSIFLPSDHRGGGTLFIMETTVKSELGARYNGQFSDRFEAFVYCKPTLTTSCKLLPPPPFVHDPKFSDICTRITSYAVLSGGSEICISVEGAGTYCLDTVKHTWRHVGDWTLPFNGKVEYVPDLKLWFGFSAKTKHLAAADLSAMDSQPKLVKTWMEFSPHKGWRDSHDAQFVQLGCGRFCVARFFYTRHYGGFYNDEIIDDHFAVLTGVDVLPVVHDSSASGMGSSSQEVELQMFKYGSKLPTCKSTIIEEVF